MERMAGGASPHLALAAALASFRSRETPPCADLRAADAGLLRRGDATHEVPLPNRDEWIRLLRESAVVGTPGEFKPLILDVQDRLWLHRCLSAS